MTSPLILNLRSVLTFIEEHRLPHRHIGGGTGGPHYIDVGVDTWPDVDTWSGQLGGTIKIDENGRRDLHATALGLNWMVYSDEKRPAETAAEAAYAGPHDNAATVTT